MITSPACCAPQAAAVAHNCATNISAGQDTSSQLSYSQNMRPAAAAAPAPPRTELLRPGQHRHHPPAGPAPPGQHRAAARRPQPPCRQPGLDTSRRTSYRHHRGATSWHPSGGLPRIHGENEHGEGRCHHQHGHGDAVQQHPHPEPAGSHQNDTVNGVRPLPGGHPQRRVTTTSILGR
jgi:hypothetical protein